MHRSLLPIASLVLFAAAAPSVQAQKAVAGPQAAGASDVCEVGTAEAELDAGGVRARLYDIGGLFWRVGNPIYEVPKGSGTQAIFSHSLWLGGEVGGELRFAGSTYGHWEFWPGPLDENAEARAELCAAFDRIWTVATADLEAFDAGGSPADDLAAWPVGVGAPYYVDADGDGLQGEAEPTVALRPGDAGYDPARVIDLSAGERPVVFGAQTAWWVMNDRGGEHRWSEVPALGVEVRVTAWTLADAARPDLYFSTFYRYDILNRSADPFENVFAGLHTDGDLGDFNDDFLHSDSTRSMQVLYNGDEDDASGTYGYGVPPALGIDVLSGAYAAVQFSSGGTVTSDPGRADEAYTYMQGLWKDGTPFKIGGDGYNTNGPPSRWQYGGEPGTFWSEDNTDGAGRSNTPAERRGMISAEIGRLGPGEETTLDVGILFAQGGHRLDSVVRLKAASDVAQAAYASGDLFRTVVATGPPPPPSAPLRAPTLLAPAPDASFDDGPVTFDWTPVDGATGYRIEFSVTADFSHPLTSRGPAGPRDVLATQFPPNRSGPVYWRVVPTNVTIDGPPSEARQVSFYRYAPGPLTYGDGEFAFVEVVGPGGVDPCGPEAESTDGCAEVFGNGIYGSANSTGDYVGTSVRTGPEGSIGASAPSEFEIRFTEAGSYAYYLYTTGNLIHVPFEVWDVGPVAPGQPNDPADDVQMVAGLFADGGADECEFGYSGPSQLGVGPITQRIYAHYAVADDYAAYEAEAASVVEADPDGCPTHPATAVAANRIDIHRARPLQRFVLEQASDRGLDALMGTVIRFYTVDEITPAEGSPERGTLALAVFPNPAGRAATVAYEIAEAGRVVLRLVDVLGRELATLAEGARAAGPHRAQLPTAALSPGVYLVVLDTGGARAVQRVTVVR